jgi:hypothetical protein
MAEKIIFNGKVYRSPREMPSDIRAAYERINRFLIDNDRDGIPDILQDKGFQGLKEVYGLIKEVSKSSQESPSSSHRMGIIKMTDAYIEVNGKRYPSVEEMPPKVQFAYETIMADIDPQDADIYDEPWRKIPRDDFFKPHDDEDLLMQPNLNTYENPIQEVTTNNTLLLLLIGVFILICFGIAAWFILFGGQIPGI